MTRKHFEAIARITASISNDLTRSFVAHEQADYFANINPRFDRNKFLAACGVS